MGRSQSKEWLPLNASSLQICAQNDRDDFENWNPFLEFIAMPQRSHLQESLAAHEKLWYQDHVLFSNRNKDIEAATLDSFRRFLAEHSACFERHHLPGHMTGSALVINKDLTKVLLTHHRKLNMWLQLGGHADGHHRLDEVAIREAVEESGLQGLYFLPYESLLNHKDDILVPFDIDCHLIPETRSDPAHHHFDVRYLVVADDLSAPIISEESHDVSWFTLDEARKQTSEESMHRQFYKLEWLRSQIPLTLGLGDLRSRSDLNSRL